MNGDPLPLDHGAPVRLVVPGWYGCSWIKWVDELRLADSRRRGDDPDARVRGAHAPGRRPRAGPRLRRRRPSTSPPRRSASSGGASTGGSNTASSASCGAAPSRCRTYSIRFDSRDAWKTVRVCPAPTSPTAWSLWTYRWTTDRDRYLQHLAQVRGPVGTDAAAGHVLLHAPRADR